MIFSSRNLDAAKMSKIRNLIDIVVKKTIICLAETTFFIFPGEENEEPAQELAGGAPSGTEGEKMF